MLKDLVKGKLRRNAALIGGRLNPEADRRMVGGTPDHLVPARTPVPAVLIGRAAELSQDETRRLRAVRHAMVVAKTPVITKAQDAVIIVGCLVAREDELAKILTVNIARGNIRIFDLMVQCGLRPNADLLTTPKFLDAFTARFGKELLSQQRVTMRGVFCRIIDEITSHDPQVREAFLGALRTRERFVSALNTHLKLSLGRYLFLLPKAEFGPLVEIIGRNNITDDVKAAALSILSAGVIDRYFGDRAIIAAQQIIDMFLGGDHGGQGGRTAVGCSA